MFSILQEAGVLPPAPESLVDRDLSVAYISVLAQAQRLVATGAVDRLVEFTGQLSAVWPEARHKVNASKAVDEYADSLGVDPDLIRSDREVAEMVQQEQAQAQQAQQAAAMQQGVDTAKTASEINPEALTDILGGAV